MKNLKVILLMTIGLGFIQTANAVKAPDFIKKDMKSQSSNFAHNNSYYSYVPNGSMNAYDQNSTDSFVNTTITSTEETWKYSINGKKVSIINRIPGELVLTEDSAGNVDSFIAPAMTKTEREASKIVFNRNTGEIGILTDELTVFFKKGSSIIAEDIAKQANIALKHDFKGMGLAYFVVQEGRNIIKLRNEISNYEGVKAVELNIIEHEVGLN
jgi:hypothetical protein